MYTNSFFALTVQSFLLLDIRPFGNRLHNLSKDSLATLGPMLGQDMRQAIALLEFCAFARRPPEKINIANIRAMHSAVYRRIIPFSVFSQDVFCGLISSLDIALDGAVAHRLDLIALDLRIGLRMHWSGLAFLALYQRAGIRLIHRAVEALLRVLAHVVAQDAHMAEFPVERIKLLDIVQAALCEEWQVGLCRLAAQLLVGILIPLRIVALRPAAVDVATVIRRVTDVHAFAARILLHQADFLVDHALALFLERLDVGIIPAHAGLTASSSARPTKQRDHPRACGAHLELLHKSVDWRGSSPRMRGSLSCDTHGFPDRGIIPSHAGLTTKSKQEIVLCGAHGTDLIKRYTVSGSSPRMRGSRRIAD